MAVILVRHGETALNAARILQPAATPLSERGQAQARAVAQWLAQRGGIGAILCSDLPRAWRTAEAIGAALGLALGLLALLPLLPEMSLGAGFLGARLAVLDRIHGLARLQPLLDDPDIRDIHISGAQRVWLNLRDGTKVRGPAVADSDEDLVELISTAARRIEQLRSRIASNARYQEGEQPTEDAAAPVVATRSVIAW